MLPAYSPELNPMEKLWDIVKDKICSYCWETLEELEREMTKVLKERRERSKGFSWADDRRTEICKVKVSAN